MNEHERDLMSCRLGPIRNVRGISMNDGANGWRRVKLRAKRNRPSEVTDLENMPVKCCEKPATTV